MSNDDRDMQIRKFLKRVGVESHKAIADALAAGADRRLAVQVVLTIGDATAPAAVFEDEIGD